MEHEVNGEEDGCRRLPLESDDSLNRHGRGRWITALGEGEGRDAMLNSTSLQIEDFFWTICPLQICLFAIYFSFFFHNYNIG